MTTINLNNNFEKQHNVILEDRKKLVLSGVFDVISFEEDNVQLKTSKGELNIRGDGLKMENFILETGDLTINGNIYALVYLNDSSDENLDNALSVLTSVILYQKKNAHKFVPFMKIVIAGLYLPVQ